MHRLVTATIRRAFQAWMIYATCTRSAQLHVQHTGYQWQAYQLRLALRFWAAVAADSRFHLQLAMETAASKALRKAWSAWHRQFTTSRACKTINATALQQQMLVMCGIK
jgi:hypothetical protein